LAIGGVAITNVGGDGMLFGTVTAICGYAGDPTLTPSFPVTADDLRERGYVQFGAVTPVQALDGRALFPGRPEVQAHRPRDRPKQLPVDLGRFVEPGEPPADREARLDRVATVARIATVAGLEIVVRPAIGR